MTLAGLKKCSPITSCGRPVTAAISSMSSDDVLVPRIAPGFATRSSREKISFFSAMFSNTASMIEVGTGERRVVERRRDQREPLRHQLGLEAAARDRALVVLADRRPFRGRSLPARCRRSSPAAQRWRSTSQCRRPSSRHRRCRRVPIARGFTSAGSPGILRSSRSPKNRCRNARPSTAARPGPTARARAQGPHRTAARRPPARRRAARCGELRLRIVFATSARRAASTSVGALGRHRARRACGAGRRHWPRPARERTRRRRPHVAVDDRVDQADLARLRRANRLAGQHQVQRRREADQPRQPLRAAGAGDDAERDLGHRELRACRRDALVAGTVPSPRPRPSPFRAWPRRPAPGCPRSAASARRSRARGYRSRTRACRRRR